MQLSRREFVTMTVAGAACGAGLAAAGRAGRALSAQDVVDRIKKNLGVEWKAETVDTFKAGDPATVVTGIATTALPTLAVLNQAVKAGANLIVTSEPAFYSRAEKPIPGDPVFAAKHEFIKRHQLVVWRFSEHWRFRKPDPMAQGLADALGWAKNTAADDAARVSLPPVPLDRLASHVKQALHARGGIRVIGDPKLEVRTIGLLPGNTPIQAALKVLPSVDAIVAGEVREWESAEYVRDKVTAGEKKALVLIGRIVSEEPGMSVCARWLGTIVPEVKATAIAAGDPYWRPL